MLWCHHWDGDIKLEYMFGIIIKTIQNAKQCLEYSDVTQGFLCIRNDCWIVIELSIMIYENLSGDIS